jgi:hypothetical protein
MMSIDKWANFLKNEKLDPKNISAEWTMKLIQLCEALASIHSPKISMHKFKIESRKLVVETAMNLGIDLASIRHKMTGRYIIGRGLLDVWNQVYKERYGAIDGTRGQLIDIHRKVVTHLRRTANDPVLDRA